MSRFGDETSVRPSIWGGVDDPYYDEDEDPAVLRERMARKWYRRSQPEPDEFHRSYPGRGHRPVAKRKVKQYRSPKKVRPVKKWRKPRGASKTTRKKGLLARLFG